VVEEVESPIRETHKVLEQLDISTNPMVEPSFSGETSPTTYNVLFGDMADEKGNENNETEKFGFPILDITRDVSMKNILISSLPHFHGMSTEDPYSILFEFDILCRSYNYTDSAQKLKLFPATFKDSSLRWFMSLREHTILSWDGMKETFLQKYQDYRPRDARNDIFKMQQYVEESLEDYLERFIYNYQKTKQFSLDTATISTIFLKCIRGDCIEVLNLMSSGDVYQKPFADIAEYCKRYSHNQAKTGKSVRFPIGGTTKPALVGATRIELGNMLEKIKTCILNTISIQLDTMKIKKKQEEENATLAIFCPRCRKKHPEK
jgi:hypothetical protein